MNLLPIPRDRPSRDLTTEDSERKRAYGRECSVHCEVWVPGVLHVLNKISSPPRTRDSVGGGARGHYLPCVRTLWTLWPYFCYFRLGDGTEGLLVSPFRDTLGRTQGECVRKEKVDFYLQIIIFPFYLILNPWKSCLFINIS